MTQQKQKQTQTRKRKTQKLKEWKCSKCGAIILCMHRKPDSTCYECRMRHQQKYQHEHRALRLLPEYN